MLKIRLINLNNTMKKIIINIIALLILGQLWIYSNQYFATKNINFKINKIEISQIMTVLV